MTREDCMKWDAKYETISRPAELPPNPWLVAVVDELPPGRALDVACGLGQNAFWLVERGWEVTAVDISSVGLECARRAACDRGVSVDWQQADLDDYLPPPETFDLICVFRFLDRGTLPGRLIAALRPGGSLVYETFSVGEGNSAQMKNPAYQLQRGELPLLYRPLSVVVDEIVDNQGETLARFLARKPYLVST